MIVFYLLLKIATIAIVVVVTAVNQNKMGISALQYQKRLQPILSQQTMKSLVSEIVLSDQQRLKEEKINEFELGLRPDGNIIGHYRDPEYRELKQYLNPKANGNVDLLYTYRTARSLFVRPFESGFLFNWNDEHNLVGRYGLDILGLNQDWFNKRQKDIYRYTLIFNIKKIYKIA